MSLGTDAMLHPLDHRLHLFPVCHGDELSQKLMSTVLEVTLISNISFLETRVARPSGFASRTFAHPTRAGGPTVSAPLSSVSCQSINVSADYIETLGDLLGTEVSLE